MVGPLDLPIDPSEEDLRLCLRDGKVLCKLVKTLDPSLFSQVLESESSVATSPSPDSVTKFLKAAAVAKLSLFEVLDLEQPSYHSLSSERVVDCILSFKAYHERTLKKDYNLRKSEEALSSFVSNSDFDNKGGSSSPSSTRLYSQLSSSTPKSPSQHQRRSMILGHETFNEGDMHTVKEYAMQTAGSSPQPRHALHKLSAWESMGTDENFVPASTQTGINSAQIHQITQRFREILRHRTRGPMQDQAVSQNKSILNSIDNPPSQAVSSLINAALGDKQHEDVSNFVELMLKKVMEEVEKRLISQNEQVAHLKNSLKEHLTREDKLVSRTKALETLAAGSGEELKIYQCQLQKTKLEKEKIEEELASKKLLITDLEEEKTNVQAQVESLERQLLDIKKKDHEYIQQLKLHNQELEHEIRQNMDTLKAFQGESARKIEDLEAQYSAEKEIFRKRDQGYHSFLLSQRSSIEDVKLLLQSTKVECLHMHHAWSEEAEDLRTKLQGLAEAASGYHKVLAENRQLYNEVQDLKGNIRVYCRVRPFLPGQGSRQSTVDFVGENGDILIANPSKQGKEALKMFSFNKSFGPSATQEEVFMDTRPLIRSVLDGYNVCIFAYGQTGSGKTYTMTGPNSLSEKDWGVNYRALNDLFHISQSRVDVFKYEVSVQMVEIYNEQVRDLLLTEGSNKKLEIRNHSQLNGLNVPDASMLPVTSTADVLDLIKIGQKNRAVGATALNERSSRSHSVLTVHVQGTDLASGSILRGCLHLVDLAGSERVDKSEATGDRLKEAQHINKSLSALGDVVSALAQKSSHVPYRNSKLTQLLQNSLAGQAKSLMFVHISPDIESFGETMSTLKFAERVASVELGAARSNKESKEVRDLKEQVNMLKDIIAKKDGEIERLQSTRITSIEESGPLEKSKIRAERSLYFHKPTPIQMKQTRLRRQTVDVGGQKEKWLAAGRRQVESQSQELDPFSPPTSPKESRRSQDVLSKEKLSDFKKHSSSTSGRSRVTENHEHSRHENQKGNDMDYASELKPKDWQDRVQSSTDSSLLGTSSVDDLSSISDGIQIGKIDGLARVSDGPDGTSRQGAHQESVSMDFPRTNKSVASKKMDTEIRNMRSMTDAERPHIGDLDSSSELSDGYVSQAETENSLTGVAELASSNNRDHRLISIQMKPPQPQRVRPSRGDWKSLNIGQPSFRAKQQTVPGSFLPSIENISTKKQLTAVPKHSADVSPLSESSGRLAAHNVSKSSKRWVLS
ncbi:hypothetical protein KP509_08G055800 [Ceratopteris richardii]|nr:hypothetical protein KP509_08G055800 [Ceratopteris richardii]